MSKCPASLIQFWFITTIGATIGAIVAGAQGAIAQVSNDPLGDTSVSSSGNTWVIGAGSQRGNSLFHNLIDFKIQAGITALFKVDTAFNPNVDRVVTYVRNAAEVNGNLRIVDQFLNLKTADLFLLSPNGITFGPSAFLDVRGALFVTTANRLTFDDGVVFENGRVSAASGFSTHKPIEFGFGPTPGAIRAVTETTPIGNNAVNLNLGPNLTALAFLGGNVELKNRGLQAPAGGLYLGSVQGNETIQLGPQSIPGDRLDLIYPTQLNQLGLVQLTHRSFLTSANGNIEVTAKDIKLTDYFVIDGEYLGSYIASDNGDIKFLGQTIQIDATGIFYNNGDVVLTSGSNSQGQLNLSFTGIVKSSPAGTGMVEIMSQTINMDGFGINTEGGDVTIGGAGINMSAFSLDSKGGLVDISATNSVNMFDFLMKSGVGSIDIDSPSFNISNGNILVTDGSISVNSTVGSSQLMGNGISISDVKVKVGSGNISLNSQGRILLDRNAGLTTTGNGSIQLVSQASISLKNNSKILAEGSGDLSLSGDVITLNKSRILSDGSGDLNLSGRTLDLTGSLIRKDGLTSPGSTSEFNLGPFDSISLRDSSRIVASNWVNFRIQTDRLTFEDAPASRVRYRLPVQFSPDSKFPADVSFSCDQSGNCDSIQRQPLEPIPDSPDPDSPDPDSPDPEAPRPESPRPESPLKSPGVADLPASPVESTASPKVVSIPLSGRDSASQSALNLRCQGPIARQVLFQRSGRGGLLATPGASLATDVFQDFGGQGLGSSPRSAAPIASAVATPAMALEAQNWQVDPQGRISLLASAAVTSDRASQECPDPLTQ
jgi:filamentous hemagglutinin family protein